MKIKIIIIFLVFAATRTYAQNQKEERNYVREGNSLYKKEKYTDAEISYRKALEKNTASPEALYNLGNALFRQNKGKEAAQQYKMAVDMGKDSLKIAQGYHNIGNVFFQEKDYQQSIEAYKQALRRNPTDNETRYNLRLAQLMLKKQQQEKQDQKEEKKEDKKDQNKKDKQQEKPQNKPQEQPQKPEQQQGQMSKENAQQILDGLQNDEKQTQERMKKALMQQQKQRKTEKDW